MLKLMMSVLVFASALYAIPAFAKKPPFRGCEECPFPMREWSGSWWNEETGLKLEIENWDKSSRYVNVIMRDIDSGRVVASGIGYSPMDSASMQICMHRHDGVKFNVNFTLEPHNDRIHAEIPSWIRGTLNGQDVPTDLYFED